MSKEVKDLILATGSMAEICAILRDNLMKNGFTRTEAIQLCGTYISSTLHEAMEHRKGQ